MTLRQVNGISSSMCSKTASAPTAARRGWCCAERTRRYYGMCCADLATASAEAQPVRGPGATRDLSPFVIRLGDDLNRGELAIEGIRCAACMGTIEGGLAALPGVT